MSLEAWKVLANFAQVIITGGLITLITLFLNHQIQERKLNQEALQNKRQLEMESIKNRRTLDLEEVKTKQTLDLEKLKNKRTLDLEELKNQRQQDMEELNHLEKFREVFLAENPASRDLLALFYSNMAPTNTMRDRWLTYRKEVILPEIASRMNRDKELEAKQRQVEEARLEAGKNKVKAIALEQELREIKSERDKIANDLSDSSMKRREKKALSIVYRIGETFTFYKNDFPLKIKIDDIQGEVNSESGESINYIVKYTIYSGYHPDPFETGSAQLYEPIKILTPNFDTLTLRFTRSPYPISRVVGVSIRSEQEDLR